MYNKLGTLNEGIYNMANKKPKQYCTNKDLRRELESYHETDVISEELGKDVADQRYSPTKSLINYLVYPLTFWFAFFFFIV